MPSRRVTTTFTFELDVTSRQSFEALLVTISTIPGVSEISNEIGGTGLHILRVSVSEAQSQLIRTHKQLVSAINAANGVALAGISLDGSSVYGAEE